MNQRKLISVVAILASTNLLLLSHFSGYRFDLLSSFNWDIALMLTPYGLINNLLIESEHYLRKYYFLAMQKPPGAENPLKIVFIISQSLLSLTLVILLTRLKKSAS